VNDGSGDTEIGRSLYPRAPDMRAGPTQELTDGERADAHGRRDCSMEQLNPKTAEQWRARRFLAGEDVKPSPTAPHKHDGSR